MLYTWLAGSGNTAPPSFTYRSGSPRSGVTATVTCLALPLGGSWKLYMAP